MKVKYEKGDVGVIVGRFQVPDLHEAHKELIDGVCSEHQKVIIFLGLSPLLVTRNNPLDFEARKQMLLNVYPKVNVLYIKDDPSDEIWSKKLDSQISDLITPNQTVTLYGGRASFIDRYHGKFHTQELLQSRYVSGSEIRKMISKTVKSSSEFRAGVIWAAFNQFKKCFTCVDIAIIKEGQLLLARKENEEKYRFIGGFSEPNSPCFEDDAKREVMEESGIEVADMEYVGSSFINDWRYRGEEDKIKTVFYKCKYIFGTPKANDDICEVRWFDLKSLTLSNVNPNHHVLLKMLYKNLRMKLKEEGEITNEE